MTQTPQDRDKDSHVIYAITTQGIWKSMCEPPLTDNFQTITSDCEN